MVVFTDTKRYPMMKRDAIQHAKLGLGLGLGLQQVCGYRRFMVKCCLLTGGS